MAINQTEGTTKSDGEAAPAPGISRSTSAPGENAAAPPIAAPVIPVAPPKNSHRKWIMRGAGVVVFVLLLFFGVPAIVSALSTVSTDDAYVNGHSTAVAPRVPGQVMAVYVDDNNRVHKGDLILQLDKEPYNVQVGIKKSAVAAAESDLTAARAQVRTVEAYARSLRWKLQHSMEDVENQIALLKTNVAVLDSAKAIQSRAQADYDRALPLIKSGAVASEELDRRKQVLAVADAQVQQALQGVYQTRVSLGLVAQPLSGGLADVPVDLDQTFSSVREAQAELMQTASQVGVVYTFDATPRKMLEDFLKRNPEGNIDRIYAGLLKDAPAVKQAEAKVVQMQRDLDEAELNLKYCDVFAEIDGVITRRNINPGDHVIAGQEVMVIRSLRDIWVDANFKETELAELRIGQPVTLDVDMYGKRKRFEGRISGFTMGTGSTLALLPAQNATGNFVKVVQRLPVRIDVLNYDPETDPLFIGLSVTPYVHYKEKPTGDDAGKFLQPYITPTPATQPSIKGGAQ